MENNTKNFVGSRSVIYMGGTVQIVPAGSFTDQKTGKEVVYGAKVKLGSLVDSKGTCNATAFLAMIKAVTGNKDAIELLEKIA